MIVSTYETQTLSVTEDITLSSFFSKGETDLLLLPIHGLGTSKEDFLPIFEYPDLKVNSILVPDLVGHGDASRPPNFPYSMADQADILLRLLEAHAFPDNIVLIAHSMGGPIAVSMAELLGNRVVGIIYAEGNLDESDCFFSKTIIDSFSIKDWIESGFNKFLARFQKNSGLATYATTFSKASPVAIYRSSQDLFEVSRVDTLTVRLSKLFIPILGIYGARNKGKFDSEKKFSALFPIRFIPNAGHSMMLDNPDAFYKIISNFLLNLNFSIS